MIMIEHSDLIGLFLRHDQSLEMVDVAEVVANTISPSKRGKSNSSNNSGTSTLLRRYELNRKLFAINEPYLMKTERDSLVKLIDEQPQQSSPDSSSENGVMVVQNKTAVNRAKKRKKALCKKVTYLEQNLSNDGERSLAAKLIDQCLLTTPPSPTTKTGIKLLLD